MTRRNRKKTKTRVPTPRSNIVGVEGETEKTDHYVHARQLAQAGRFEEAIRIYDQLKTTVPGPKLRALIENDFAAIAVMQGRTEDALDGWKRALAEDAECRPARLNREMIEAEFERVNHAAHRRPAPLQLVRTPRATEPTREPKRGPVRVAILSFLFNWPSTGGGNVHTYELAEFLVRSGYEVRHIYARYQGWGIGRVAGELPYPSEAIELDASNMRLDYIRARYRQAVDAFDPDQVIITDSWNIKPILAQAVRGYPYILRLQAMETLCPLNNLRLLFDERGSFRQCAVHQLATPGQCTRCLAQHGHHSGPLHQAERSLCEVGSPKYHRALFQAFAEADEARHPRSPRFPDTGEARSFKLASPMWSFSVGYLTRQVDLIPLTSTVIVDTTSVMNARRCFRSLTDAHIRPAPDRR